MTAKKASMRAARGQGRNAGLSKQVETQRARLNVDLYNALNASPVLLQRWDSNDYGVADLEPLCWRRPA